MATRVEVCSNCRFWQRSSVAYGLCKRHAPVSMALSVEVTGSEFHADKKFVSGSVTRYPETNPDDWCGDFDLGGKQVDNGTKWQPIETAPKDCTLILIRERCGRVQVAKWSCPDGDRFDWYVQLTQSGDDGYPTWDVVQWAPIPK